MSEKLIKWDVEGMKRVRSEKRLLGANKDIKKPMREGRLFCLTCIKSRDDLIEEEHIKYVRMRGRVGGSKV